MRKKQKVNRLVLGIRKLHALPLTNWTVVKSPFRPQARFLMKVTSIYGNKQLVFGQGQIGKYNNKPLLRRPCYITFNEPQDLLTIADLFKKMAENQKQKLVKLNENSTP